MEKGVGISTAPIIRKKMSTLTNNTKFTEGIDTDVIAAAAPAGNIGFEKDSGQTGFFIYSTTEYTIWLKNSFGTWISHQTFTAQNLLVSTTFAWGDYEAAYIQTSAPGHVAYVYPRTGSILVDSDTTDQVNQADTLIVAGASSSVDTVGAPIEQFPSWSSVNGHIIPDSNAAFDIGSAEYKVRHLFLSDNSLWIGNNNKLSISNGKVKSQKRKASQIPTSLQNSGVGIGSADLLAFRGGRSLNSLTPSDWLTFAKQNSGNQNLTLNQLYSSSDFDEAPEWTDYIAIDQPTVGDIAFSGSAGQTAFMSQINTNAAAISTNTDDIALNASTVAAIDTSGIATNAAAIAAIDTSGIATNAAAIAAIDTSGIATNASAIADISTNKHAFSDDVTFPERKKVSFLNDDGNERGTLQFRDGSDHELEIRVQNANADITKPKTISLRTTSRTGLQGGEPEGEVEVVGKLKVYEAGTNTWHNIVERIDSNDTTSAANATNIATLTSDFSSYVPERLGGFPGAQVYTENLNGGLNLNAPKGNTEASIRMNTVGTPDGDIVLGMVDGPIGAFGADNVTLSMRELVGLLRSIKTAADTSTDGDHLRALLQAAFSSWNV
jgi:hypothetical protein